MIEPVDDLGVDVFASGHLSFVFSIVAPEHLSMQYTVRLHNQEMCGERPAVMDCEVGSEKDRFACHVGACRALSTPHTSDIGK
jgi:hypothetical protein